MINLMNDTIDLLADYSIRIDIADLTKSREKTLKISFMIEEMIPLG